MILRVTIKPLLHTATGSSALDSSYPLTFPRNRLASTLPSGAHPDKSEWFHCTRIHTIVDERLGISENKAMKLLISTFFTLLLIGFAGGAYSNPPYSGTVWVDLDIITAADPSAFIQIVSIESGPRIMFDRRADNGNGDWVTINPRLFQASYTDGNAIEIQVNPEFDPSEAAIKAKFYGYAIGQLPKLLRLDVKTVWIHKGDKAFGGGNDNIFIHTDSPGYHGTALEETLFHEACHTSLDSRLYGAAWSDAQTLDAEYISTYAKDNPAREDVAESCALYYAVRFKPERLSEIDLNLITKTIKNRMLVFDSLGMEPVTDSDRPLKSTPSVAISGSSRTISDTDNAAGESVSFTATATDSDGTIATTQWLVDGVEVATGLSATLSLPNGLTVVTFKATDDDGTSSITTATITVASPAYEPTEEWPSPYNGVTPDSSYGLEFNNVGVLNSADATIYVCLRIFTDGLPSAVNGVSQFDMGLKVASLSEVTVQITKFREFDAISALNEKGQTPDCSGIFETTTGVYTDIIQTDTSVLETTWNLIDPTNLILKLDSFKELTAN